MPELNRELREIYLQPGELHIAREPAIIRKTLAACIGITFWSAKLRVGALAHPLLPNCPTDVPGHRTALRGFLDSPRRQSRPITPISSPGPARWRCAGLGKPEPRTLLTSEQNRPFLPIE